MSDLEHFLRVLFPQPFPAGRLTLCSRQGRGSFETTWCRSIEQLGRCAGRWRQSRDLYFGIALKDPELALEQARRRRPAAPLQAVRGGATATTYLPALWADVDVAGPHHAAGALPPDQAAALGLIDALELPPTFLVATGAGFHAYWLLHQGWMLSSDQQRSAARELSLRLQITLRRHAQAQGWSLDHTADLARVLRLPGSLNHKSLPPRPVAVLTSDLSCRYSRAELGDCLDSLPESALAGSLAPPPGALAPLELDEHFRPADYDRVVSSCSWLRHCRDHPASIPEPEWYAALTIVGRCATEEHDGCALAHRISSGHPTYSPAETEAKLERALVVTGPRGCRNIAHSLGAHAAHCRHCPHFETITGPINLGRPKERDHEHLPPRRTLRR